MMPRISVPSPVPGLGHFNHALMGHSCQAPKLRVNVIPRKLEGSADENGALTVPLSITGKLSKKLAR